MRRSLILCALLGVLILGWVGWRNAPSARQPQAMPAAFIDKQPVDFENRTFDPEMPPADMPPLGPGEDAECDSNFLSHAIVGGQARQTDATHATVTITQITVTLRLNIDIWVPTGVTEQVVEHEQGHRQISEFYYQDADKVAERIASAYMGRQIPITGTDLHAEFSKLLQQTGADITDEYNKVLNPEAAQLRYDAITDHSRNNDLAAVDAVAQVLKDVTLASDAPTTNPGN